MYCSNCGKPLDEGMQTCPVCGASTECTSHPDDQKNFDHVANAVWFKANQLWDWLLPRLIKWSKVLALWGNEVWDRFVTELPFRLPKRMTLIAVAALIVLNAALTGGTAGSVGNSSNSGGGSSIWSSNRISSSTSSVSNCVFCSDGKVTCTACDGDKGKYIYGSVANYSGSTSPNTTTRTWQSCGKCNGSGKQDCTHCGG